MNASTLSAVLLAAGFGKRMKSALPKVLHPILGLPMIEHCLRAVSAVTGELPVVIVGHGADQVRRRWSVRAPVMRCKKNSLGRHTHSKWPLRSW